jgi:RNA polymerase sigma factor (sigma-70 family)
VNIVGEAPAGLVADGRGFADAVRPFLLDMGRLATRLVGAADADDVAQEALSRAWRKRALYEPSRGSLRSWLLAITADQARRWSSRRPGPVDVVPTAPSQDREAALDLRFAVSQLATRQRLAVELRYYLGLPVTEVAEAMGISEGTAKSTLADARARLRERLEEA